MWDERGPADDRGGGGMHNGAHPNAGLYMWYADHNAPLRLLRGGANADTMVGSIGACSTTDFVNWKVRRMCAAALTARCADIDDLVSPPRAAPSVFFFHPNVSLVFFLCSLLVRRRTRAQCCTSPT